MRRSLASKWLIWSLSIITEIHLFEGEKSPAGMAFSQLTDNNKQAGQKQMVAESLLHCVFNRHNLNIKCSFSFVLMSALQTNNRPLEDF